MTQYTDEIIDQRAGAQHKVQCRLPRSGRLLGLRHLHAPGLRPEPDVGAAAGAGPPRDGSEAPQDLYRQAEQELALDAAIVPLLYSRMHLLLQPWVRSYPVSPLKWWFWKDVVIDPH